MKLALLVLATVAGLVAVSAVREDVSADVHGKRYLFDSVKYSAAKCLDGSPAGVYARANLLPAHETDWIIMFEGGGECVTRMGCTKRANTTLGSSREWPEVRGFYGMQDHRETQNPEFYAWNQLLVPYCSGDLFLGLDKAPNDRAYGLQFSGFHGVTAAVDFALRTTSLWNARRVIITGESAGGIAAVAVADAIKKQIEDFVAAETAQSEALAVSVGLGSGVSTSSPLTVGLESLAASVGLPSSTGAFSASTAVAATKEYYLVPIAGSYFNGEVVYTGPEPRPGAYIPWAWKDLQKYATLWNAFLPAACVAAHAAEPWRCIFSEASYPTVSMPVFAVQAQTDAVVVSLHAGVPQVWLPADQSPRPCFNQLQVCPAPVAEYLVGWTERMRAALKPVTSRTLPGAGAFFASCFLHTEFSATAPKIGGLSHRPAVKAWLDAKAQGDHVHMDNCADGEIFCGQCK